MRPTIALPIVCILALLAPVGAQEPPPTDREKLIQVKDQLDAISQDIAQHLSPPLPPPPTEIVVDVDCGESFQAALTAAETATLPTTIRLERKFECEPGYVGSFDQRPALAPHITITTRGWTSKGEGHAGRVTPADAPNLALLKGDSSGPNVLLIHNGENAGRVTLFGLAFGPCPTSTCNIIEIGSGNETDPARLASNVTINQVLIQGDPVYGAWRGIAANGRNIEVTQVWCENIWRSGFDSTCLGAWRGGINVTARFDYFQAGSENLIVGGSPYPDVAFTPTNWLVEDVILHKPERWRTDGIARVIKNLLELKQIRGFTGRRIAAVGNWSGGQSGVGLVITTTTNGNCPSCPGISDTLIEDFVMLKSSGGVIFQGYSYISDSNSLGRIERVTLRNHYYVLNGGSSNLPISITNVKGRHDIRIERSSIVHSAARFLSGDYGYAWEPFGDPAVTTRVAGAAMQGLWMIGNVISRVGSGSAYGITAPQTHHYATGLGLFIDGDQEWSGNIIGGAGTTFLSRLNAYQNGGTANTTGDTLALTETLAPPVPACGTVADGVGADCARLAPVFAMLQYLPEP